MVNTHENCKEYIQQADMCLLFTDLTTLAFNVSTKTDKCLKEVLYDD